jgi:hypothetical protein
MPRPSPAAVLAFIALVASLSGAAVAAIPARDGDVHLCYNPRTGQVELVDTQRDRFSCPRRWRGFIVDTKPTQLVSPDGRFKVEATNSGARLTGPEGRVEVGRSKVLVVGDLPVEVTGGTTVDVTAGAALGLRGGAEVNTIAGRKVSTLAGEDVVVQATKNLELLAEDRVHLRARLVPIEALLNFNVETKDARIAASGVVDLLAAGKMTLRASQNEIDPPPNSGGN